MFFVSIFDLENGVMDDLIGPFDDAVSAMTWADHESLIRTTEKPGWTRQSNEEMIMVANFDADDADGWCFQVIEPSAPTVDTDVRLEPADPSPDA